jgi:hypothetical protein
VRNLGIRRSRTGQKEKKKITSRYKFLQLLKDSRGLEAEEQGWGEIGRVSGGALPIGTKSRGNEALCEVYL